MHLNKLELIGSEEWCVFETLGIPAIKARVDSGAKTSSIQAANIKLFSRGAQEWVKFEVNPLQDNRAIAVECEAKLVDRRTVRSSSGISEERVVIKVPISMGNKTFDIELTLASRDTMEFRMLLGREALSGRYIVNPAASFCLKSFTDDQIAIKYASYIKEKTGLKLALLASNPELYSNRRLMEAAEGRGHEIVFLNVELAYMKLDAHSPEIRYRGGNILNEFDAIIPRIKPAVTFYGCALIRQFANLGVYCLNTAE
ncbi:MAG: RimK/LysX family protein, partial [Flavobacteriaceae bacterium]